MGHLQPFLVLLLLGCTLDATMGVIPVPTPKPTANKVVAEKAAVDTTLMECTVAKPTDATYTTLTWKRDDGATAICTVTKDNEGCTPATDYAIIGTANKKHDLVTKKVVDFTHAGKYTCSLTKSPETKDYDGQLTVVGHPNCPETIVNIPTGAAKTISCDVSYKGTTAVGITMKATGVDETGTKGDADAAGVIKVTASHTVTTTAATAEKTYTCAATAAGAAHGTDCTIKVIVYDPVITKKPELISFAKIDTTDYMMPCTADPAKTYALVKWYKQDTVVCTGKKEGESDACVAGYKIDIPAKHDLSITKITEASVGQYSCNVEQPAGAKTAETHTTTLAVVKKADPLCDRTWDGATLNLNCTVEFKGTDTAPTITWTLKDKTDIIAGTTGKPSGTDWKSVDHTATVADASNKNYICHVKNGNADIATCEQAGASALSAKFLQSTLLSLVVVFMLNRFK